MRIVAFLIQIICLNEGLKRYKNSNGNKRYTSLGRRIKCPDTDTLFAR